MGKEYKPKYKLTIKYPRLPLKFESGDIVYYNALSKAYVREKFPHYAVDVNEVENNPDFWEEVKQPLFVTDDNIEIFDDATEITTVSIKHHTVSKWGYRYLSKPLDRENFKHFGVEVNAYKYIEENKPEPLFITEDGVEVHCRDWELFGVEVSTFKRAVVTSKSLNRHSFLLFAHESNADEYIWRNMRLFSYEDVVEWYGYGFKLGREGIYETLERLAIERSEE